MMAALPTLSHLRGYNTDHLAAASMHWTEAAGRWRNTYITVEQETGLLDWEGAAREAAVARVARDHAVVRANASALEQAASIAREAASSLLTMAHAVTHLADEATENGYMVNDDYSVDFPRTANVAEYKTKFFAAEKYSADLRFRAGNFMAHEHQTAADLIQAVDNHTIPNPPPGPVPPGKQWWYHEGTGWKLDDHLHPCTEGQIEGDLSSIAGGVIAAPTLPNPAAILGEFNALRGLIDIEQCEGP